MIAAAVARAQPGAQSESRGVTAARGVLATAPFFFVAFALGVFLGGGWLRSVGIRFLATARHLRTGLKTFPDNWWRTLFVIDLTHPPEILPGYRRKDLLLQISQLVDELKKVRFSLEWVVYVIAIVLMFVPAYLYRLTIKSTCWFYIPMIYIVRPARFAGKLALLVVPHDVV